MRLALVWVALVGALPSGALAQSAASEGTEEIDFSVEQPLASRSLLLDGTSVEGLMVAVGERGHILLSTDQGESWRQAKVPTRATLAGVYFHDSQRGWAVGHDAVIVRTVDGGQSWERVYYAPEEERPLLDVWFRDASHGFAIGAYGFFLVSSDGGLTWTSSAIGGNEDPLEDAWEEDLIDYHLNQIARSETGRLYIAAEAGTIYRSDDEGQSWESLPSPYEGSFFGTLPLAGDSLLLFGLRGNLFRSDDEGQTWEPIETGTTAMLTDGVQLEDGTVIIVGLAGTLLVSRDGGETFFLKPQADRQGLATVLPRDDGGLVLIGEFGVSRLPAAAYAANPAP